MKILPMTTAAVLAAVALAACGSGDADTDDSAEDAAASGDVGTDTAAGGEDVTLRLWLNGEDTPQEMVDFAVAEFAETHPDVEVVFERQQWTGIVEKLTTALSSSDSPDIVELGNTQAQAFEAAGALADLTDNREDLGGDDLLQSLVEAGTYDGSFYGVPYYAGARIVVYRTDMFEASGIEVPTTMQEFVDAGAQLKEDNADVANFSGIHWPGKYWYAALPFVWEHGGDIATQGDDGEWTGQLSSPESVAGLEMVQDAMTRGSGAPTDGDESTDYVDFCNGQAAMLMGPGWKVGQILNEEDGCPELADSIGAFALPGLEAGTTAPVFLGGSNLAVSAASPNQELAVEFLSIMLGDEYQTQFAELGLLPARKSLLDQVGGDPAAEAQAAAAQNSRFVPSSENWAGVEAANVLPDMLVKIAQGEDVESAAADADAAMTEILNG